MFYADLEKHVHDSKRAFQYPRPDESLQAFIDRTICHVRQPFPSRHFAELTIAQDQPFPGPPFEPSYVYAPKSPFIPR